MWRLIFDEDSNITYHEACLMDPHELREANAALDLHIERKRKAMKKK